MPPNFNSIIVLKELRDYITPLSDEELQILRNNILEEGLREPLILWQNDNNDLILVDGHNRFKICKKYNLPFKIKKKAFLGIEDVKIWMVDNQMGRRNLTGDQLSYYRGLKYLTLKRNKGGYDRVIEKGKPGQSTSDILSERFKVSESTIKRDAKFAEGINIINKSNPGLKKKILKGELKIPKGDVQILADAKNKETITIKNEADLHNKSRLIREALLDHVESEIKRIEQQKVEKDSEVLMSTETVFLSKEDRLKTIKGKIVSAVNKAINSKDIQSIRELKKLIDRLENELF